MLFCTDTYTHAVHTHRGVRVDVGEGEKHEGPFGEVSTSMLVSCPFLTFGIFGYIRDSYFITRKQPLS